MVHRVLSACVLSLIASAPAFAQVPVAPVTCVPGATPFTVEQMKASLDASGGQMEIRKEDDAIVLRGLVELPVSCDTRISAEVVEVIWKTGMLIASGNVVFATADARIHADRVEYNIKEGTGTFRLASGIMSLGPTANRAEFGNQDPDVYFWGELIEKLSADKYRLTDGGFTTCVQPEPRWAIGSNTVVLNRNDYAMARNMVLRVKGVPLLYLPLIYYPIREDQRSTGFLMPSYGTSTIRGSSISNGFFWAIDRSQDATFFHDWFARAGQGMGGEYRYVGTGGSGDFRLYRFSQQQQQFTEGGQTTGELQALTSYEFRGGVVQSLGRSMQARGQVQYSTNLLTQQLYQQNLLVASSPVRIVEGTLTGGWGPLTANGTYQRAETFLQATRSTQTGATPRISATVAPTRLFGSPVYASLTTDFGNQPYRTIQDGAVQVDYSLARFDVFPTVRVPFTRLTYLSANTTAAYRLTRFSRSTDLQGNFVAVPILRRYYTVQSQVIGPVFSKVWETPGHTRFERMKHVIEPVFSLEHLSEIPGANRLFVRERADVIIGNSQRFTYGLTNRILYRTRASGTTRSTTDELLTVAGQQTYYSNKTSSLFDSSYAGSASRSKPVDLSPISVITRLSPGTGYGLNTRIEYDVSGLGLQTVTVGGSFSVNPSSNVAINYSRVASDPSSATSFLIVSNRLAVAQGRGSVSYALNWDLSRSYVVSQTVNTSYLAQCCGLQFEYQQYNFPDLVGFPVTSDRRFNIGVVLAGLGTFSNFFGAFGGQP